MTKEEYINRFAKKGIIGLCELCHSFSLCASIGKLRENGCNYHSNFSDEL